MFQGELAGAREGSTTISFVPGRPQQHSVTVDMGTAASITLVLQAVVPAVALSRSRLTIGLIGGTDVPWSPTFDYYQRVVTEGYRRIGIVTKLEASQRGYYPKGGGRVTATIEPCESVASLDLATGPAVKGARLTSRCGRLPRSVAERQARSASELLQKSGIAMEEMETTVEQSESPGSSVLVYHIESSRLLGSDALGERGKPAEQVGREAAGGFVAATKSGGCIDSHLADMLVPLLALAKEPSRVRIPKVTAHLESGLRLAQQFTSCTWTVREDSHGVLVSVKPPTTSRRA